MADIKKELNQIKTAIYGKDVRGSIHDGIDKINKESEDSKQKANEAHDVMESIINDGFDNAALEANFEQKLDDEIGRLQPEWTQFKNDTEQNFNSVTSQLNDTVGDSYGLFSPPIQPDINSYFSSGNAFAMGDKSTYDEYVALFENLYLENQDYIKKFNMGTDSGGWRKFQYYVYEPKSYQRTVIVGSGLHGGEKLAIISLYNFLKLLVGNWRKHPQLANVRNNVRLVVMPLQNPAGVYSNSRVNGSAGVDLNRNFDYLWSEYDGVNKGDYAASEFETQCIQSVLEKYKESTVYIDLHNMSAGDRSFKYSHYIPSKLYFPSKHLKEIVHEIDGFSNPQGIEIISSDFPMATNYAANSYNMIAFNPEYIPGVGVRAYGSEDMTTALRFYSNLIIYFCGFKHKGNFMQTEPWTKVTTSRLTTNDAYSIVGDFADISRFNFSFIPTINGLLEVEYVISLYMEGEGYGNVASVLTQDGNTPDDGFYPDAPFNWHNDRFGSVVQGDNYQTVVTKSVIPVDVGKGQVNIKLIAGTNIGTMRILRVRQFIKFTPSERYNRLIFNYSTKK